MVRARGVPGVSWALGRAKSLFTPNPNKVGDCTTTLRQSLIGAFQFCLLYTLYI